MHGKQVCFSVHGSFFLLLFTALLPLISYKLAIPTETKKGFAAYADLRLSVYDFPNSPF